MSVRFFRETRRNSYSKSLTTLTKSRSSLPAPKMGLADNRIPAEQLPECWLDDVRMNALFAPFRPKSSNPESWDMKMKFWSDMLKLWCRHKKDPIVSAAEARIAFQRKGRTPACLEIVIEECFRSVNVVFCFFCTSLRLEVVHLVCKFSLRGGRAL